MRQVEGGGVCWSTEEADWLLCISVRSIRPERGFSLWGDRIERRGGERGVLMTGFTPELCVNFKYLLHLSRRHIFAKVL